MAYTVRNFKTKKELKQAVANGEHVMVYQPNDIFGNNERLAHWTGHESIEGPHYPQPHTWYASVEMVDGVIVKVK